jgi:NADH:ubiquinone oxidoreductase subunit
MSSYKLSKSLNKLPRFFNAKIIELIDKFSSAIVYFALGLSMGLEGLFDETLSYHNLYITLKDSEHFKEWHREVEDYFDNMTKKMQGFLEKFGEVAFTESDNAEDVRQFMQHITSDVFYHSLNSHSMDKKRGALAQNLYEIGQALEKAHGWHRKGVFEKPRSKSFNSASYSDHQIVNLKKKPFTAKKERSSSAYGKRYPGSNGRKNRYRIARKKTGGIGLYPSLTVDGRSPDRKKLMFKLKSDALDSLNKKKKVAVFPLRNDTPKWKRRIKSSCKKARVSKAIVIAKSNFFNKGIDFIFNAAVSRDSQWFVVAGKDMPIVKYNYYGHQTLKKSYKSTLSFKKIDYKSISLKVDKYDYIWIHDAISKSLIVLNSNLTEKYTLPGNPITLCNFGLKARLPRRYGI